MATSSLPNGTHLPETPQPKHTSLALTEYTTNPSPQTSTPKEHFASAAGVPDDLLLPNGFPDVSTYCA